LQVVLKVDTQHAVAKELRHEGQHGLQRQVRGEQIKQLRANAEEAFSQRSFQDARAYAEQALTLDKSNTELLGLRDKIATAKQRKDKLDASVRRAESAQASGDLDAALKAADDAVAADPDNTQARSLHSSIAKELSERSKQKQLQGLLEEARKDISGRKFTAAFEVLKKAETVDPSSPEIAALMNLASSGRDQEARRRDLEKFTSEIEDALSRDAYQAACEKVEQALSRFAGDPGLLRLKALAEKQRANEGGRTKDLASAVKILETAAAEIEGSAEIQGLLQLARDEDANFNQRRRVDAAAEEAQRLLSEEEYEQAVSTLEAAMKQAP